MEQLKDIRCPTLILAGDLDYTPIAVKQAYTAMIAGAELVVIPDARHMMPIERPELFNDALMSFLDRASMASGGPDRPA